MGSCETKCACNINIVARRSSVRKAAGVVDSATQARFGAFRGGAQAGRQTGISQNGGAQKNAAPVRRGD
jgi:hypothetical protein